MAASTSGGYRPLVGADAPNRKSSPCPLTTALLVWGGCALFFAGLVGAAVFVAVNENDGPDCRKSAPLALFTLSSHPASGLRQDLCDNQAMFLMYGGKGKKESSFDE
mmetsp:Transcript_25767/g.72114  ORF Transcript_25767/g.72114 Transcript_25767/m.72114 type:complete len:107 (-) Transcript_25767:1729-2049(-)